MYMNVLLRCTFTLDRQQNARFIGEAKAMPTSKLRDTAGLENGGIDYSIPRWYVAYTKARHEKKVAAHLEMKQVEVFLPLYRTTHMWNARRAVLQLPLFPGYVFVRTSLQDRLRVLDAPGLIQLVGSRGMPIPLTDAEVEQFRVCVSLGLNAEPVPYLQSGDVVRIVDGPFEGWKGRVIRSDGETRFVLSVDMIMRSVAVKIEASRLERICEANAAAA
jgi:transcription antitermination factor NusG